MKRILQRKKIIIFSNTFASYKKMLYYVCIPQLVVFLLLSKILKNIETYKIWLKVEEEGNLYDVSLKVFHMIVQ